MQDKSNNNANGALFIAWLEAMEWDKHGGRKSAAEALGKTTVQIDRYKAGANIALDTQLAMTAISEGLKPWTEKDDGLPAFHVSLSIG